MLRVFKSALAATILSVLTACATPKAPADYTALRTEDPHSILVVPAMNRSTEVTAPDYFLSTISIPLAERGYYVFPVNLVKRVMDDDGMSDADMVQQADPTRLGELFGADAILYVTIERWDSRYLLISTTTTVEISYVLKSGKTGATLWTRKVHMEYTPQAGGTGLAAVIGAAIEAAVAKAAPNYIPLANRANLLAIDDPKQGLPPGPRAVKVAATH